MDGYQVTALVPIKGASERVPGKNVRDFCGTPLMCRILETLDNTEYVSQIIVDTDSELVANLAATFHKVKIHERPKELVGHHVPMNEIIKHDLTILGQGHFFQTHVTNPLLTAKTISNAIERYFTSLGQYDSLFSATVIQSRFFTHDLHPINHDPAILLNTQDLQPVYEENSCMYLFSHESFMKCRNRIGTRFQIYPMGKIESLDIDTEEDFQLAQSAWNAFRQ